jgi:hypothetical protein
MGNRGAVGRVTLPTREVEENILCVLNRTWDCRHDMKQIVFLELTERPALEMPPIKLMTSSVSYSHWCCLRKVVQ